MRFYAVLETGKVAVSFFDWYADCTLPVIFEKHPELRVANDADARCVWWRYMIRAGAAMRDCIYMDMRKGIQKITTDHAAAIAKAKAASSASSSSSTSSSSWHAELEARRQEVEAREEEARRVALDAERSKKAKIKLERAERVAVRDREFERRMQQLNVKDVKNVDSKTTEDNKAQTTLEQVALKHAHAHRPKAAIAADFDARQRAAHAAAVQRRVDAKAAIVRKMKADESSRIALMEQAPPTQATLGEFVV